MLKYVLIHRKSCCVLIIRLQGCHGLKFLQEHNRKRNVKQDTEDACNNKGRIVAVSDNYMTQITIYNDLKDK